MVKRSGVPCEFLSIPGAFHGFDLVAKRATVTKEFFGAQCDALREAFAASRKSD